MTDLPDRPRRVAALSMGFMMFRPGDSGTLVEAALRLTSDLSTELIEAAVDRLLATEEKTFNPIAAVIRIAAAIRGEITTLGNRVAKQTYDDQIAAEAAGERPLMDSEATFERAAKARDDWLGGMKRMLAGPPEGAAAIEERNRQARLLYGADWRSGGMPPKTHQLEPIAIPVTDPKNIDAERARQKRAILEGEGRDA